MSSRSYTVIFILLGVSVLAVLVLQAYWLQNFYRQKVDQFNSSVYSALDEVVSKLHEREQLSILKERALYVRENSGIPKKFIISGKVDRRKLPGDTAGKPYMEKALQRSHDPVVRVMDKKVTVIMKDASKQLQNADLLLKKSRGIIQRSDVIVNEEVSKIDSVFMRSLASTDQRLKETGRHLDEIGRLMDKVITEVNIVDTGEKNADTLKKIVRTIFANKGIFGDFELAIKNTEGGNERTVSSTKGFAERGKSYRADLSSKKAFSTNNFLFIQFHNEDTMVMAAMKGNFILSIIFSLVIVTAFCYTLWLINRQRKISEIKNDFVNNMTHELKTPIATIGLAIDAMNNPKVKNDPATFNDYTRILKEENRKLNSHVERVLQVSMIGKGDLELRKKVIPLKPLLESSVRSYALLISEKKAKVDLIFPAHEINVFADEEHLGAVFSNLLDNALKYSDEGCEVVIEITEQGSDASIKFRDNGLGISRDQQEKIFDKFYRVQGGNLHDVKGFGLGLSYVRSVVAAHGGTVEVKSEKGRGSEFTVTLKRNV